MGGRGMGVFLKRLLIVSWLLVAASGNLVFECHCGPSRGSSFVTGKEIVR